MDARRAESQCNMQKKVKLLLWNFWNGGVWLEGECASRNGPCRLEELTWEDKLLSMLNVAGSFRKNKRRRGQQKKNNHERLASETIVSAVAPPSPVHSSQFRVSKLQQAISGYGSTKSTCRLQLGNRHYFSHYMEEASKRRWRTVSGKPDRSGVLCHHCSCIRFCSILALLPFTLQPHQQPTKIPLPLVKQHPSNPCSQATHPSQPSSILRTLAPKPHLVNNKNWSPFFQSGSSHISKGSRICVLYGTAKPGPPNVANWSG